MDKALAGLAREQGRDRTNGGGNRRQEGRRIGSSVSECDVVAARGSRRLLTVGVVGDGYPERRGNACAAPSLALTPHAIPSFHHRHPLRENFFLFFSPSPSRPLSLFLYHYHRQQRCSNRVYAVTYCPPVPLIRVTSGRSSEYPDASGNSQLG